jgi:hypothetical protein
MKWIYRFFMGLGIIFFLLLVGLGYFLIVDPWNLRPLYSSVYSGLTSTSTDGAQGSKNNPAPNGEVGSPEATQSDSRVSNEQAQALQSVGLDSSNVPTKFTDEQKDCFIRILGQERVNAIVAGDTPTPAEFYSAKECL